MFKLFNLSCCGLLFNRNDQLISILHYNHKSSIVFFFTIYCSKYKPEWKRLVGKRFYAACKKFNGSWWTLAQHNTFSLSFLSKNATGALEWG